jgi:hypothetical protein
MIFHFKKSHSKKKSQSNFVRPNVKLKVYDKKKILNIEKKVQSTYVQKQIHTRRNHQHVLTACILYA